jgi:hypothetical protein
MAVEFPNQLLSSISHTNTLGMHNLCLWCSSAVSRPVLMDLWQVVREEKIVLVLFYLLSRHSCCF